MKIILIGESCWDYYRCGTVNRISPEAPIPVLDFDLDDQRRYAGMTMNVNYNFENFGVDVDLYTRFVEEKVRYSSEQYQLLRVDLPIKGWPAFDFSEIDDLEADALVISDYNKGFLSYKTISRLREEFSGPMFIDTKKPDLQQFEGIVTKINQHEYDVRISEHPNPDLLIVTGGAKEIRSDGEVWTPKEIEMVDVCGAGDTFFAAYISAFLTTNNKSKAIEFAMSAAAVTVQHRGVYAPKLEEI